MERRCVAMISGGLDSSLAARLMLEQGIEVFGLYLAMSWGCCEKDKAVASAHELGIPLMVLSIGDAYLDVIRNPKYGYGTAMNPCIDCRIYMFRIARRYMEELGAGFVVTGEVVGQRPMSQRRQPLGLIEADSGLEGLLLRPLSARLLEPTLPELLGVVDREALLAVSGRSRQQQLALAKSKQIAEFSTPAGGCLLTDEQFAAKARDLFQHDAKPTTKDMELLTIGRHFRIGSRTKVVIGRTEVENLMLEGYAGRGYACLRPEFAGPAALIIGPALERDLELAAALILRHTPQGKRPSDRLAFKLDGVLWSTGPVPAGAPQAAAARL
ncbi:MAG TPA: hypothetical protein VGB20_06365 [bacterium]